MRVADQCDVVVIGAGPAGSTAAQLLASWGWSVVLVHRDAGRHSLAESLPPSTRKLFAFLGQSIPVFLLGMVLILVFAVGLRWLPSSGGESWKSLILPAISIGSFSAAVLARLLRSSLLEVLSQEYIRTAYAKGLAGRTVVVRHALKNAALPFVTMLGLQVGFLLSGAVVAETIFAYPGMGRLAVEAISRKDVPVIQSFVTIAAVIVIAANLFVDLVYTRIDPRIRLS